MFFNWVLLDCRTFFFVLNNSPLYIYIYIAPTSVRNVGLIRKNQKGLKIHQTSKHQRKQNIPTSPGFWPCHLTPDVRPVNQGCSIPPSAAQIMAINTSSNNLWPAKPKMSAISSIAKNVINNTQAKHNSNSIRGWTIIQVTSDIKRKVREWWEILLNVALIMSSQLY